MRRWEILTKDGWTGLLADQLMHKDGDLIFQTKDGDFIQGFGGGYWLTVVPLDD